MSQVKTTLTEEEIPKQWYNILPDLPAPLPPLIDPKSREPVKPDALTPVFPLEILKQEMSNERWIDIPEELREVFRLWRPTPLMRARRLEKMLKTPAKIFYKYEGVSPPGSHKPNTAVAQAYYNMKDGQERLATETGAGQWGSAVAYGCAMFGLDAAVYMVKVSYDQKPYRRVMMQSWGADVVPSPSTRTKYGKSVLENEPDNPGSLGIAISEAVEDAVTHEGTKYVIGSVLNHVLMHQTVIGLETKKQLEQIDEYPDMLIGCVGGGSSFSGLFWPFYHDRVSGKAPKKTRFIAVEPTACPTLTKGLYLFDHGDTGRIIPLVKMYTLGHDFVPAPIHAGGLRYHGDAPTICMLVKEGQVEARAYDQVEVFDAAVRFSQEEGIISAPEPAHAIKATIDEALRCKETGEEKTIVFNLCGHGHFDMQAYDDYFEGKLPRYEYPGDKIQESLTRLKNLYPWTEKLPY